MPIGGGGFSRTINRRGDRADPIAADGGLMSGAQTQIGTEAGRGRIVEMSHPADRLRRRIDATSRVMRWSVFSRRSDRARRRRAASVPGADASLQTLLDGIPARHEARAERVPAQHS